VAERGKARIALVSTGSNTRVASGGGTLYRVLVTPTFGSTVRIDDSLNLGAAPNMNGVGADTIGNFGTFNDSGLVVLDFAPGVGFNAGLAIAATSNARLTVVYEP
jgi:hypothetical protein